MKRFSANQREMDAYSPREHGEEQKGPMTLIRTTANKDHAIAPKVSRRLAQGWEEFVYSERIRSGIYGKMASLTGIECRCGKGAFRTGALGFFFCLFYVYIMSFFVSRGSWLGGPRLIRREVMLLMSALCLGRPYP